MILGRKIRRDENGSAAIEFAIAVPILVAMIHGIFSVSMIFLANAGLSHALGEASRMATLFPTPSDDAIIAMIEQEDFGLGNGSLDEPEIETDNTAHTKTITLTYEQDLDLLFIPGPTVTLTRSKVVYFAY